MRLVTAGGFPTAVPFYPLGAFFAVFMRLFVVSRFIHDFPVFLSFLLLRMFLWIAGHSSSSSGLPLLLCPPPPVGRPWAGWRSAPSHPTSGVFGKNLSAGCRLVSGHGGSSY